jgi:hypothetical protein
MQTSMAASRNRVSAQPLHRNEMIRVRRNGGEHFRFIEGWYNPHRWHPTLGYLSPVTFERLHACGLNPKSATVHRTHRPFGGRFSFIHTLGIAPVS